MIFFSNWIIVGGTGRNTGKTTLVEKLIGKFAKINPVTAVKMANIKPGNENFHGHVITPFTGKISIEKETRNDGNKDSMRFLRAGAQASWFIQTEDDFLPETFPEIRNTLKKASWIVCESNSLRNYVKPALFIMVKGEEAVAKKNTAEILQVADVVVDALNWRQFDLLVERIEIREGKFVLLK